MKQGDSKLFKNRQMLCNMLTFRVQGWSLISLSLLYDCDRTSISFQCVKYDAFPLNDVYSIERITKNILPTLAGIETKKWREVDGERVCVGKSYQEYLNDLKNRENLSPYKKVWKMA